MADGSGEMYPKMNTVELAAVNAEVNKRYAAEVDVKPEIAKDVKATADYKLMVFNKITEMHHNSQDPAKDPDATRMNSSAKAHIDNMAKEFVAEQTAKTTKAQEPDHGKPVAAPTPKVEVSPIAAGRGGRST